MGIPALSAVLASGMCTLFLGLLVISARKRQMATGFQYNFHSFGPRTEDHLATKRQPAIHPERHAAVSTPQAFLVRNGFERSHDEELTTKIAESSIFGVTERLPEEMTKPVTESQPQPLSFQATGFSTELPSGSLGGGIESLDPITPSALHLEIATQEVAQDPVREAGSSSSGAPHSEALRDTAAIALEMPEKVWQHPPNAHAEEHPAAINLLEFYGMKQQPFDVTPDPAYLYFSASHREALTSLSQGIENFRGFMALIAEPGMGKTTLLNRLMEELSDSARVIFLFQTQCNSNELLAYILNELEVDHAGMDVVGMHRALNQALLEEMLRGRRFVLIVDEAQNLQDSVLETIRLLSDFETTHSKLIQIVLAGQPQLVDTLTRDSLAQLRQRIAVLAGLRALSDSETSEYIEHRLRAAGWADTLLFTSDALDLIAEASAGVPRRINNICFNALLLAFTQRRKVIDAETVRKVAGKLDLEALARRPQQDAVHRHLEIPADRTGAEQRYEASDKDSAKHSVIVTGKLIEKARCQSWSRNHESRIEVSFERDPSSGISVADRHYCCNFYIGEAEAASLQTGAPIRIKIEQD